MVRRITFVASRRLSDKDTLLYIGVIDSLPPCSNEDSSEIFEKSIGVITKTDQSTGSC